VSISYVGTGAVVVVATNSTPVNVPMPSGVASGDLLVMFWSVGDHFTPITPSGWTVLGGDSIPLIFRNAMYSHYRVAGGSEPANYPAQANDGTGHQGNVCIAAFRGVDTTNPINVFAISGQQATTAAPTSPSVTTTAANCALIAFAIEYNQHAPTLTVPSGSTQIQDSTASGATFKTAYNLTTGAAGSYNPGAWSSSPANDFTTMTIALKPLAGPASDLSGSFTAEDVTWPSGAISSIASSLTGTFNLDDVTWSGLLAPQSGTVATQAFKNDTGSLLVNFTVPKLAVLRLSDMTNLLTLTNQVTNPSTGVLTVSSPALVAGTDVLVVTSDATGANVGNQKRTVT